MEAYPEGEIGHQWNVTLEIGSYPSSDFTCTKRRSIFTMNGTVQGIKDYRFCRGCGEEDLYIDEGNDVTIRCKWINDVLVSPFKYQGFYAISMMRMRGDILEEQILITDDIPAEDNRVVSVKSKSLHLMTMKRISNRHQNMP